MRDVDVVRLVLACLPELFHERGARVVRSRDGLLTRIWGNDRYVTVRSVDTLVSRLRRRIEPDNGENPRYIHTVRGVGYKLGDA